MFKTLRFLFFITVLAIVNFVHAQLYVAPGAGLYVATGGSMYVAGDVTLATGSTTTLDGTIILTGSKYNNGTIFASSGTLEFMGSSAQSFNGSLLDLGTLNVNNSSGGLTLNAPVSINTATVFTSGLIHTNTTNLIIYKSGASIGSPTDASHVNGAVRYLGSSSFTFPVGNLTWYRPVNVALSANASGLDVLYNQSNGILLPPGTTANYQSPLKGVSRHESWNISPVTTATGTVTLNWDVSKVPAGILMPSGVAALRVGHYNSGIWLNEGGTASGVYNGTGSITTSSSISTWSPFALATIDLTVATLPLNFMAINAKLLADNSRIVSWDVEQEINVNNYTIQRSTDGRTFKDAGVVAATGTQSRQTYSYNDAEVINAKTVYYRVRGNDIDGKHNYSNIAAVNLESVTNIKVQPNPVATYIIVSFGQKMKGTYDVQLYAANGALLLRQSYTVNSNETITINRPAGIAQGVYTVKLIRREDGYTQSFKLQFQ